MKYLEMDFLKPYIKLDFLNQVIEDEDSILHTAEAVAMEQIVSKIEDRFDVEAIFCKADDGTFYISSNLIANYMVDLMLYHIHSRINPRKVPELRQLRYEAAMDWLNDVRDGMENPNFKLKKNAWDKVRYGSLKKIKSNKY